ncbi:MAG: metallophosphoesterase family protein, partial [Candidatus Hadarchaeia archaeon]
ILVHSGDVTQSGKREYYKLARKYLRKVDIPYVVVPGNHDYRSGGFSLYKEYIGPSSGIEEFDDALIIYVDSGVPDSNGGRVGMAEFEMIKDALNEYREKSIKIVVIHHHTLPVPKAGRERNVLSNAGDLLELFLKSDVDLVLSGHRHHPNVHKVEDTVFVNAGTASGTKTRHGDTNSYNVVEISADEINVKTHRVNNSRSIEVFQRKGKRIFHDFGERELRMVQVANTYISSSSEAMIPNTTKFKYTHFFNAVDTINDLDADLVVHCGGIVEEGISRNYSLANKYMSRIESEIIYTPAGRDINYLGYELFQDFFGRIDQSYSDDKVFLQGVSSAQYDSRVGLVGENEREILFEKVKERDQPFNGLFLHHNVIPIPHSREKGLLEDSGNLLRRAVDEEIDLMLTGTSSHPLAARVGGTVIVNANSFSSVYQRSKYGNSFNLIDIYENAIVAFEVNSLWGNRRTLGIWDRNSG